MLLIRVALQDGRTALRFQELSPRLATWPAAAGAQQAGEIPKTRVPATSTRLINLRRLTATLIAVETGKGYGH
jgi:hypothetical protein